MGRWCDNPVVSELVNVPRALCALALAAGLALAGCGQSKSSDTASGTPQGDGSTSAATGSASPGTTGGGAGGSGGGIGGGGGGGGSSTGGGAGGVPKPGAPPECTELASAPALHEIGDTLDQMDTPDTAAQAKATLHADAAQLNTIASHTGNGTLKARLIALASAIDSVANTGTDNMVTMLGFVTALRDVSESVQDVCGIGIG
jgi:hypothetical protein